MHSDVNDNNSLTFARNFGPSGVDRLFGAGSALLWREALGSRRAAFEATLPAQRNRVGVLPLFLRGSGTILDLPSEDVPHQLPELHGIAGAFEALGHLIHAHNTTCPSTNPKN
jgi:hypothetical protein